MPRSARKMRPAMSVSRDTDTVQRVVVLLGMTCSGKASNMIAGKALIHRYKTQGHEPMFQWVTS